MSRIVSRVLAVTLALCTTASAQEPGPAPTHQEADRSAIYPSFSWDHVPLYMHIRKAKSYSEKEIAFLARFPLITFEKSNGHLDHGSIEKGTLIAARAVKKLNPKTKILYYRNVIVHYGSYDCNEALKKIPNALLADAKGNTKLVRNRVQAYDLSNPAVCRWWVESCRHVAADPAIDGVFLDGNIKALEPGYLAGQIGRDKKQKTIKGYHQMMRETREAVGPGKLMVANILRARFPKSGLEYMHYFDGSYLEGFFHNVGGQSYQEYVAKGMEAMQKAARSGKIIAFSTTLTNVDNKSAMGIDEAHGKAGSDQEVRASLSYKLALFLICAGKYSYFRIHEGYSADKDDRWMRWFPEYDKPLGPPEGPATKEGPVYTRKFAHADVWLDISKRQGKISWK